MVLAGRDEVLANAEKAIAASRWIGHSAPLLLVGGARSREDVLRGEIAYRSAVSHGSPHIHVEVTP